MRENAIRMGIHRSVALLASAILAGCSGASTAPSAVDLTGAWSGRYGIASGGGLGLGVEWIAAQTGRFVSGPATFSTSPRAPLVAFTGILEGTIDGTEVSLTYLAPPGSVPAAPDCSIAGHGVASIRNGTLTGSLDLALMSCDDVRVPVPPRDGLRLSKQQPS